MRYSFTFYWNAHRDQAGHLIGFLEGYQPGHRLEIAYQGFVSVDESERPREQGDLVRVADVLFAVFNDDDRARPAIAVPR